VRTGIKSYLGERSTKFLSNDEMYLPRFMVPNPRDDNLQREMKDLTDEQAPLIVFFGVT